MKIFLSFVILSASIFCIDGAICLLTYEPVCVVYSNGTRVPYGNLCAATNAGIKDAKIINGTCCYKNDCSNVYAPVCATKPDGSTVQYDKKCLFDAALSNLELPKGTTVSNGECKCEVCKFVTQPFPACGRSSCGGLKIFDSSCDMNIQNNCKGTDFVEVDFAQCLKQCGTCSIIDISLKPICVKSGLLYHVFPGSCSVDIINKCLGFNFVKVPCL